MEWQFAPVDDNGTRLAYLDSGAPPTADYTTIVIVHGHTFHAPVFSRLLPVASKHNARVIALNRRDYVHSTPFSDAELNVLAGQDEDAHSQFLRERGLEIAKFLCYVITELEVTRRASSGGNATSSGGLVLMGWSLGNLFTVAFIAHLSTYPPEVTMTLEPYLKSLVIYAPPSMFLGYPNSSDAWNPFYVPENPRRLAPATFGTWVTSYYKHPAFSERQKTNTLTPASFSQHTPEQQYRLPTTDTISADELDGVLDPVPNERSERFYFDMSSSMMHAQLEKAMLGAEGAILPHLKVDYVFGQEDVWLVTWAACEFERDLERWRIDGEHVRPTKIHSVPGANHMIHWDDPDVFLEIITKGKISQK